MLSKSLSLSVSDLAILFSVGSAFFLLRRVFYFIRRPLKFLRGPKPSSFLAGYEHDLSTQISIGDTEYRWYQEYGPTFRASGAYGEDVLMTGDPKALQYVLQTSGYRFRRTIEFRRQISRTFGRGVLWADGELHQRHRKVLSPAFSAQQLKQFLTMFQQSVNQLSSIWKEEITQNGSNEKVLNIPLWLNKITLDVIGKTSFDFDFGALDDKDVPLRSLLQNLFNDSAMPSISVSLHRTLDRYAPLIVDMFPVKQNIREKEFFGELETVAQSLYKRKQTDDVEWKNEKNDILSVLARANQAGDPKKKLDDSEVLSQIATMVGAGQDTISFSTTYLLYELSRHPEDQTRFYHEIRQLREKIGPDTVPSSHDYDSMSYLNAVIKEALRLHSVFAVLFREASEDDIIPLEFPVTTASGETTKQIPIKKGQRIHMGLGASNRLECVWGSDANEWNPSRFLQSGTRLSETSIGIVSNLATFGGGNRGCIGWRFGYMEMQSILFGLLDSFEFIFPTVPSDDNPGQMKDEYELQRTPTGFMVPAVKGKTFKGPEMPLRVKMRAV